MRIVSDPSGRQRWSTPRCTTTSCTPRRLAGPRLRSRLRRGRATRPAMERPPDRRRWVPGPVRLRRISEGQDRPHDGTGLRLSADDVPVRDEPSRAVLGPRLHAPRRRRHRSARPISSKSTCLGPLSVPAPPRRCGGNEQVVLSRQSDLKRGRQPSRRRAMWEFETDPEYQEQLDWAEAFVRDEVEPLRVRIAARPGEGPPAAAGAGTAAAATGARSRAVGPHLGPELGGPGYGQVKLALLNEILGPVGLAPIVFGCQAPDTRQRRDHRPLRDRGAEGEVPGSAAGRRDLLLLLDDRAPGRLRPQGVHLLGGARRRRVGHQRREVVLVERPLRRVPDRDGGHGAGQPALPAAVDDHRPGRHARHRTSSEAWATAGTSTHGQGTHAYIRYDGRARTEGQRARRARQRLRRRPDPPGRGPHPPRHAHRRHGSPSARHDVGAGRLPAHAGRDARPQAARPGDGRRVLGRPRTVPPAGAADGVEDRPVQGLQAGQGRDLGGEDGHARRAAPHRRHAPSRSTARSA